MLMDGPFSSVDIRVSRSTFHGKILPVKHLTNQGSVWDGISIKAAVPLEVSYTAADRDLLSVTLVIYALAMITTALYICIYRIMGQSQGRWIPWWLTLKRMEFVACFLCFLLTSLSIAGGVRHVQGAFLAPTFIGHIPGAPEPTSAHPGSPPPADRTIQPMAEKDNDRTGHWCHGCLHLHSRPFQFFCLVQQGACLAEHNAEPGRSPFHCGNLLSPTSQFRICL